MLKPSGVLAIAGTAPSFDFFESNGGWELKPERFRVHALATQRAADQIGRAVGWVERDELAVAALLHDVGRLVISRLHPGYKVYFDAISRTPEQRLRDEREQLGIDHALVGGVLARRWNLPQRIAVAIERHHSDDADGLAGAGRDRRHGRPLLTGRGDLPGATARQPPSAAASAPMRCGTCSTRCRCSRQENSRISEPCPLSARELDVLRHLSEGMVYKQIAGEMHLSVSTIRTHLHNVYGKIGAVDRAQAVLTARDRGWI